MKTLSPIPNLMTLGNLACGCLGIIFLFDGKSEWVFYFVLAGALMDFGDGFAARLLKAASPLGKELDSLADMVTFGVLPGLLMYELIQAAGGSPYLSYCGLLIPLFSALRLAKFNIDTRQSENFIGLPTPANALIITSLPFWMRIGDYLPFEWDTVLVFLGISVISAALLVSPLNLLGLKFKSLSWQDQWPRFSLVIFSVVLLLALGWEAVPLVLILYIVLSQIALRKKGTN